MLYRIIKLTCLHVLCVSHHFLCTFLRVCSDDVPFITSSSIIVYMLPLVIKEEHLKLERAEMRTLNQKTCNCWHTKIRPPLSHKVFLLILDCTTTHMNVKREFINLIESRLKCDFVILLNPAQN